MISTEAIQDIGNSPLAQNFANIWVEQYPDIDLVTETKFVSDRRFRADFAWGCSWLWGKNGKRRLLLPPGVLIDCHGGVHRVSAKFAKDNEKEAIALRLGFKYHRVYPETLEEKIGAIAQDIQQIITSRSHG